MLATHTSRRTYHGIALHSAQRDPSQPNSLVGVRYVLVSAPPKRSAGSTLSLAWASADGLNWSILSNDTNEVGIVEGRDHYYRLDELRGARGSDYEHLQENAPETAEWIVEKDAVAMTSTVVSLVISQTGKTAGDFFSAVSGGAADIFSLPAGTMPSAFPRIVSFDLEAEGGSEAASMLHALPTVIAATRFARVPASSRARALTLAELSYVSETEGSIEGSCSCIVSTAAKKMKFSSCEIEVEGEEGEVSMAMAHVPGIISRDVKPLAEMQAEMQAKMATMAAQIVAAKKEAGEAEAELRAQLAAAATVEAGLRTDLAAAATVEAGLRTDLAATVEAGAQHDIQQAHVFEELDCEDLFPDMTLDDIRAGNDITDEAIFG